MLSDNYVQVIWYQYI